ncbi:MAG: cytochrome C [Rhodospirillaceae bacterium]|jgi:hypothetical protein|nr:cytochrome C [Rhodospirillaceae bacterium]MBT5243719.1 cytochrome C [Rhodospirillaceae bacterium]MBT5563816.1 cytochrome C [Rhodospirillaceae bacterium]MBT6241695.1 cytochrome C [Rhodospirillaceae bacterium]MBT7138185.1 cytochrome C [Rhodospirillaceae bacterium]
MIRILTLCGLLAVLASPAMAGGPFPPIASEAVKTECAECHLLYRPQMLPAKSWAAMLADLANHFGEDASLSPATLKEVTDYHLAHASDVDPHRRAQKFLAGVDLNNPPMKITDTPRFIRKHDDVPAAAFTSKAVGSKARCQKCHTKATEGNFEDDFVVVPGYVNAFGILVKKVWE